MSFDGTITARITADISDFQRNMGEVTRTATTSVSNATRAVNNSSRGLFSGITTAVRSIGSTITTFGSGLVSKMVTPFSTAGGQIQRVISGIGQRIPQPFRTAFSTIGGITSSGISTIGRGFSAIGSGVGSAASMLTRGLGSAFSSVGSAAGSFFSKTRQGLGEMASQSSFSATKIVALGAAFLGLGSFTNLMGKAIGRVDTIDTATKSLTVLTGSADDAKLVMTDLTDAIDGTPIALNEVALGAKKMVAAGMGAAKIKPVFKSIADAAYGVGDGAGSIDPMISAFSRMQTSAQLSLDPIRSLEDQGVPALKILANQAGISSDEMQKNISSGAIESQWAIDNLVEGMEKGTEGVAGSTKALGGLAKTAGSTISGSLANMKSAAVKSLANIADNLKTPIIEALNGLKAGFKQVQDLTASEGFQQGLNNMVQALKNLIPVAKQVGDVIGKAFGFISKHPDIFKSVAVGILIAVVAIKSMIAVTALLNAVMAINPYVALTVAIVALVAGLTYFFTKTKTGQEIVKKAWTDIKAAVDSTVTFLKDIWSSLTTVFTNTVNSIKDIWNSVSTFFTELWNDVSSKAVTAWTALTTKVMAVVQPFIDIFVATWKGVSEGLSMVWAGIKEVAGGYWQIIKNVILAPVLLIFDLVTGNFTQLAIDAQAIWENIKAGASSIWNGMGKIITGVATAIWSYISGVFATMNQWVITLWNGLKATASSIWEGLKSAVTNTVTGIWNDIKGVWDSVTKSTTDTFNGVKKDILDPLMSIDLFEIGADILRGLWNGIKSIGDDIGSLIKSIADKIPSGIRKFLGIHSPSRVMAELGVYTGQGLVNGMASMQKDITQQAALYADTVKMQDYDTNNVMTADARVLGGGVSSSLDRLSSDVQNSSLSDLVFNVVNEWDGEKVVSYVQNQSARSKRNITVLNGG